MLYNVKNFDDKLEFPYHCIIILIFHTKSTASFPHRVLEGKKCVAELVTNSLKYRAVSRFCRWENLKFYNI